MSLPWFRVDTSLASHDKVLALLDDPAPASAKYRALFSYVCAIGWSVDSETDGRIPRSALIYMHGTPVTARLLVKYDLWHEEPPGFLIHNFADRQPTASSSRALRDIRKIAGARSACLRWHGPACWIEGEGCSRA
jgi:hypothetical protein